MPSWFPIGKDDSDGWRLDIVALLAVTGESFIAEHAQAITSSTLCMLPRLLPAPHQALYHSGWVCRLVRTCHGMLEMIDPLLGDVIEAAVTVPWLFQFAKVSERAQSGITLDVLRKLQSLADETRRAGTASESTINFNSRSFWD